MAPHIALNEAGAAFEPVRVDFKTSQQRSVEYLRVNPKGRVPALVLAEGTITEVPAILGWIAETYPKAGLLPEGTFQTAKLREMMLYLSATLHISFAHLFRPERWAQDEEALAAIRAKAPANIADQFQLIEQMLADGRPWLMGDRYTIADPYLYVFSRWLDRDGVGGSAAFPHTVAHRGRMQARPAVKRTLAEEGLLPL